MIFLPLSQKKLSVLSFSLFSAWLLSFPFEGQVLYSVLDKAGEEGTIFVLVAIIVNFIGLFSAGFIIKKQVSAKLTMVSSTVACIAGSLIFFLPFSLLWYISMVAMAFFSGLFVAAWAFYFRAYSPSGQRFKTAADVLIYSNLLMILINVLTVSLSAYFGLGIAIIFLVCSLPVTLRYEANQDSRQYQAGQSQSFSAILRPFLFLCVFILIFTVNSGLMYQVVNPAFAHFELLQSYYWALPYIIALLVLRNLSDKINKAYILYLSLIMIGLSFISFIWLDRSISSYLIINTLLLGAFGVADLFWWSILGNMLDYTDSPSQVFGIGLSMNVLGIFIGGTIGKLFISADIIHLQTSVIALVVLFMAMIMLPVLNTQLTWLLKKHQFLFHFASIPEIDQDKALDDFKENKQLTGKEAEVVRLLLRGYTYKAIAEQLLISENTMKFHVKNIYQKLGINSKMDLIKMFSE